MYMLLCEHVLSYLESLPIVDFFNNLSNPPTFFSGGFCLSYSVHHDCKQVTSFIF